MQPVFSAMLNYLAPGGTHEHDKMVPFYNPWWGEENDADKSVLQPAAATQLYSLLRARGSCQKLDMIYCTRGPCAVVDIVKREERASRSRV